MSITLSIPPPVVQEVRAWAETAGTSLNQYIRDCLEAKCAELKSARLRRARQFRALCKRLPPSGLPQGYVFSREEANVR